MTFLITTQWSSNVVGKTVSSIGNGLVAFNETRISKLKKKINIINNDVEQFNFSASQIQLLLRQKDL